MAKAIALFLLALAAASGCATVLTPYERYEDFAQNSTESLVVCVNENGGSNLNKYDCICVLGYRYYLEGDCEAAAPYLTDCRDRGFGVNRELRIAWQNNPDRTNQHFRKNPKYTGYTNMFFRSGEDSAKLLNECVGRVGGYASKGEE